MRDIRREWIIVGLAAALFSAPAFGAQGAPHPNLTIVSQAIPGRVTIGDEIRLMIQAEHPHKFFVKEPSAKIKLTPFEIKKVERLPNVSGKNRVRELFVLTLSVFELGDLVIPPVPIEFVDNQGRLGTVLSDPVAIQVISVGRRQEDTDDIRPIKGPFYFSLDWILRWALGILAVVLLGGLIGLVWWRRTHNRIDPESLKPAHERALLEFGRLKKKNWLAQSKAKEYYAEFADILRRYLERQFNVKALEETSGEILSSLRDLGFERAQVEIVREIFENSDLVKFAQQAPPFSTAQRLEVRLVEFVEKTKPGSKPEKERVSA